MTATVIEAHGLTRSFRGGTALDAVDLCVHEGTITGLLGRNGAGKTTLLQLIAGMQFPSGGRLTVFGEAPAENADVLSRVCFVKESQRYPDEFRLGDVLEAGARFFPGWDAGFADDLVDAFEIPRRRALKKLSRGQVSAVGIVVGLASRAPLTLFDEPYLGLDAVARQLFYDRLLADYAEHPRTIVLSTHLIDEVADLLEEVIVVDHGRVLLEDTTDALRGSVATVAGTASAVDAFTAGRAVLRRDSLGGFVSATVDGLTDADRQAARSAGLELGSVSLQQLIVARTGAHPGAAPSAGSSAVVTPEEVVA